jgi:hypothetical protein
MSCLTAEIVRACQQLDLPFAGLRGCPLGETPGTIISLTDIRLSVDILRGYLVAEVTIVATVKQEYVSYLPHMVFHHHSFESLNVNSAFKALYFEMYVAVEQNNLFPTECRW